MKAKLTKILLINIIFLAQAYAMDPPGAKRFHDDEQPDLRAFKKQKLSHEEDLEDELHHYTNFKLSPLGDLIFNNQEFIKEKYQILAALICLDCAWVRYAIEHMKSIPSERQMAELIFRVAEENGAQEAQKLMLEAAIADSPLIKRIAMSFICIAAVRNNARWAQELISAMAHSDNQKLRLGASGILLAALRHDLQWISGVMGNLIKSTSPHAQDTAALFFFRALEINLPWAEAQINFMLAANSTEIKEIAVMILYRALMGNSLWVRDKISKMLLHESDALRIMGNFILYKAVKSENHWAQEKFNSMKTARVPAKKSALFAQPELPREQIKERLDYKKLASTSIGSDIETLITVKQEPREVLRARIELKEHIALLKNNKRDDLRRAIKIIRGSNFTLNTCTHLTKELINYFKTGMAHEASTEASTYDDYKSVITWDIKIIKTEGKQKKLTQVYEEEILVDSFSSFSQNLPTYHDIDYKIDLTDEDIEITEIERISRQPISDNFYKLRKANINNNNELNSMLMNQAYNHTNGISYGYISLARAGSQGVLQKGHLLAYFATDTRVIFIDLQKMTGKDNEDDAIFEDLKENFYFADAKSGINTNTFGQYVFFAPIN
jgi:hypothetical protein